MKIVLNDKEIAELNRVASIIANDSDIFSENEVIKKDYEDTLVWVAYGFWAKARI